MHDAMRADGVKLIMLPDLIVGHKMHYTFNLYMSQRYLYARSYAGARVADKPVLGPTNDGRNRRNATIIRIDINIISSAVFESMFTAPPNAPPQLTRRK